ncbi:MAG TPA: potassium-transporting ATPase subunit KdpA [Chlamydiales bacterium]|nr:potassium-transporting ATPase subunit KdpA [Chlamydiales bacterium]
MDWIQLAIFLVILLLLAKPVGIYIGQVLEPGAKTALDRLLKPMERGIYRWSGIEEEREQDWKEYLISVLGFSFVSFLFVALILAFQYYLPLNPQKWGAPSWDLNLNTSISFMTNTNWQSYGGESTLSYFSQMVALTVQNFVSAAVGLAVAAAFVRGISRQGVKTIGNFWADLVRICLYLLLPICLIAATLFIATGVPQNFKPYTEAVGLEGEKQKIVQGPIASQQAIKLLGTNGGGYTNVNSAHPFENPTPLSNFLQMVLILLVPISQFYYFGRAVKDTKHGWSIISALLVLFVLGAWLCGTCESRGNPQIAHFGVMGGNMEGKEHRFGIFDSALFATTTTATSCGAVNCSHDSLTPIGGFVPMLNMQLCEVIFGGVGAGLYSVLLYVILCIFISGLMIGRTPEYLGKKIEAFDMKMTMFAVLYFVMVVHGFTGLASFFPWGINALGNTGPHGFSEILYAFSSCSANNGSAFAGLSANHPVYNLSLAAAMLLGRFLVIGPVIALAGSFASKKVHPQSAGSFPVSSPVFVTLLIAVIILLGALTFFPALTMGPIIEYFYMLKGHLFS